MTKQTTGTTTRVAALLAAGWLVACTNHPDEGTVIDPGPGTPGLPGGRDGLRASSAAPVFGGTLLVAQDGRTAVASDPDRDRVWLVDLTSQEVREVILPHGVEPGRGAEDSLGRVHVVTRRGGGLVTIDLASGQVLGERAVCPAPRGIAYEEAADLLHVACATGELVSLEPSGGITRTVRGPRDLRDVVVHGDSLVVSGFKSAELMVVDAEGELSGVFKPPVSSSRGGLEPFEPSVAWRMVPVGDGRIAVAHQRANPGGISIGSSGYYVESSPCAGGIVQGAVSLLDPDAPPGPGAIGENALPLMIGPSDVDVSDDGRYYAVVSIGNAWSVDDALAPMLTILPVTPDVPRPDLPSDSCGFPYVPGIEGEPVAVAFDGVGRVIVQSREPAQLQIVGERIIRLSDESRGDSGLALFHANSGFGVACASCHPEGGEDGRVWEFVGVGPRRTQSFQGGLLATAPFHWDGAVEDMDALIREVFVSRMGGTSPNQPQLDAFADWIDAVPAPAAPRYDPTIVARGRAVFTDPEVGCSTCHSGELLTDNGTYDVGTGGKFQVPALVGVGARAPFLHTGCAPTLTDRFAPECGGAAHGRTSQLSEAQLGDLVVFLDSL